MPIISSEPADGAHSAAQVKKEEENSRTRIKAEDKQRLEQ